MLIDQDKELKQVVLSLPSVEKDKLLLKLISKDVVLLEQLRYKLIELNTHGTARFDRCKAEIGQYFKRLYNNDSYLLKYLSYGQLMMDLRYLSGIVNDYFAITKDKIGEIELRLFIFEKLFSLKLTGLTQVNKENQKLLAYLASRFKSILDKYHKLHEDYQFDLQEKVENISRLLKLTAIKDFV